MKIVTLKGKKYKIDETSETPLMQQLVAQGVEVASACNGAGICGNCAFKVIKGKFTEPTENEKMLDLPKGQRLSCQCKPTTDAKIELLY